MSYPHYTTDCADHHDLVVDFGAPKPTITVLCGSTRFWDAFQEANYDLTMAGHIVLSVGFYPHSRAQHGHGEGVGHDSTEKLALDDLHKRKIDLADGVLVLNVGGYIGDSTRAEIAYAEQLGKPVAYLENIVLPGQVPRCDIRNPHPPHNWRYGAESKECKGLRWCVLHGERTGTDEHAGPPCEPRTWEKLDGAPADLKAVRGASGMVYRLSGLGWESEDDSATCDSLPSLQNYDGPLTEVFEP